MKNNQRGNAEVTVAVVLFILAILLLIGIVVGWQWFKVFSREQSGRAELAQATWNRRIAVEEAQANLEAERLNAQAEVERAKGAADAIAIEAGTLTPEYIQYLWVRKAKFDESTVIYIPTEASLPILEAGRLQQLPQE